MIYKDISARRGAVSAMDMPDLPVEDVEKDGDTYLWNGEPITEVRGESEADLAECRNRWESFDAFEAAFQKADEAGDVYSALIPY